MQNALAPYPAELIAAICRVDIATARRWKAGVSRCPWTAEAAVTGNMEVFEGSFWKGWRARGEDLISPDGWIIRRNDALAVPLLHSQIAALRAELATLKATLELPEQPNIDPAAALSSIRA